MKEVKEMEEMDWWKSALHGMSAKKGRSTSITVVLREIRRYHQNQPNWLYHNDATQCTKIEEEKWEDPMHVIIKNNINNNIGIGKTPKKEECMWKWCSTVFACFSNNGIYYEGQSMALWMKSHKEEYKETIFHHKAFFTLQVMSRIKNLRNAIYVQPGLFDWR